MSWWSDILDRFHITPPPLTWQPTYEPQAYIEWTDNSGATERLGVTVEERVTAETAEHLRGIYDPNGTIVEVPVLGPGGPFSAVPTKRVLRFPNGVDVACGSLAVVFGHAYPNDPVTADRVCREIIAAHGAQ